MDTIAFICSLDAMDLILLFWYTTLFEIPRCFIGSMVVTIAALWRGPHPSSRAALTLSVLLVGHNEADGLRTCVSGLAEQTLRKRQGFQVIVVDDGSTDGMAEIARDLRDQGLVDQVLRLQHRSGKSAGLNLGLSACAGDVVVITDVDTSLDRNALAVILAHFADDPRLGALSGDLGVRNQAASLVTRCQAIEYAVSISLGRRVSDILGILSIVSGAFGAFRRTALQSVGAHDLEVCEDADLAMKLRRAGWRIRFVPEAHALTVVPETISGLIAQRLRWDSGIVTIWLRKYRSVFDPRYSTFRLIDVLASLDVLLFELFLPLAFPVYLLWLWWHFDVFMLTLMAATMIGYVACDLAAIVIAAAIGTERVLNLVVYLPLYTALQLILRVVRLVAITQELVFWASRHDPFVPAHVMRGSGSF